MKDRDMDIQAIEELLNEIEKLTDKRAELQAEIRVISQDIIRAKANLIYYKKKVVRKDEKAKMLDELKNGGRA